MVTRKSIEEPTTAANPWNENSQTDSPAYHPINMPSYDAGEEERAQNATTVQRRHPCVAAFIENLFDCAENVHLIAFLLTLLQELLVTGQPQSFWVAHNAFYLFAQLIALIVAIVYRCNKRDNHAPPAEWTITVANTFFSLAFASLVYTVFAIGVRAIVIAMFFSREVAVPPNSGNSTSTN